MNVNRNLIVVFMLILIIVSGCAGVSKGRPNEPGYQDPIVNNLIEKYSKPDTIHADQSKITEQGRNQILDELIYLTDVNYRKFETELYQGRAAFETTTDLAILGLGAAGGLITHSATQAIISAISGGIAGSRISISKNYFHDSTTQALIAKMQSGRSAKMEFMRKAMMSLNVKEYSLARGLSDLTDYYNAGTIVGALQSIVADAGSEKKTADDKMKQLIAGKYMKSAAGDKLYAYWKPDGKSINNDNAKKLLEWMKNNGFDTSPGAIYMFISSGESEDARVKAVQDLKLNQ